MIAQVVGLTRRLGAQGPLGVVSGMPRRARLGQPSTREVRSRNMSK